MPATATSSRNGHRMNRRSSVSSPLQKNGKPRSQKRRRRHVVNFRCDEAELVSIQEAAARAGTTLSDYCRRAALAQEPQ